MKPSMDLDRHLEIMVYGCMSEFKRKYDRLSMAKESELPEKEFLTGECIAWVPPPRLGDTVFQTPAIRYLKASSPEMTVDVFAPTALSAAVFRNSPRIRSVRSCPDAQELDALSGTYDRVVADGRSIGLASGLNTLTIGLFSRAEADHASRLFVPHIRKAFRIPEPCRDFSYEIFPDDGDREQVGRWFAEYSEPIRIGLHVGSRSLAKKGKTRSKPKVPSLRRTKELCRAILDRIPSARIFVTGTGRERSFVRKVAASTPGVTSWVDRTSVQELAAMMPYLDIYVTTDTGAMQVALSTDVPMVVLASEQIRSDLTGPLPDRPATTMLRAGEVNDIALDDILDAMERNRRSRG